MRRFFYVKKVEETEKARFNKFKPACRQKFQRLQRFNKFNRLNTQI